MLRLGTSVMSYRKHGADSHRVALALFLVTSMVIVSVPAPIVPLLATGERGTSGASLFFCKNVTKQTDV